MPGYFCSALETARDVIAELTGKMSDLLPYTFKKHIQMPDAQSEGGAQTAPWAAIEVFDNNFIPMSQDVARLPHTTQAILHRIEQVFPL